MSEILKEALGIGDYIKSCRRRLHFAAETGFELSETLATVEGVLEEMGISFSRCGRAGISALIGKGAGECFLLRADMDALPIKEETGLPFASPRAFHGCGHDMHTAMLLGAAKLLKKREGELRGQVKLMFQPAEEILEGAKDMLSAGILRSPDVGGAMMLHMMTASELPAGSIVVPSPGICAPGADFFTLEFRGRGCHGASPDQGLDPIGAALAFTALFWRIRASELGMNEQAALSIGSIDCGSAANVIPEKVVLKGSIRAMEDSAREHIRRRIGEIAEGAAAANKTEAALKFDRGCPAFLEDGELAKLVERSARELLGTDRVFNAGEFTGGGKSAGSEDFAYVSREVPSAMIVLVAGEKKKGFNYPLHHPKADFDEEVLPVGAAVLANSAIKWLERRK